GHDAVPCDVSNCRRHAGHALLGAQSTINGRTHMFMRSCCAVAMLTASATLAVAQSQNFQPVTEQVLANPDPADWLMLNRTFDQQRYSPLDQVNKTNVGQLRMAWSRGLP